MEIMYLKPGWVLGKPIEPPSKIGEIHLPTAGIEKAKRRPIMEIVNYSLPYPPEPGDSTHLNICKGQWWLYVIRDKEFQRTYGMDTEELIFCTFASLICRVVSDTPDIAKVEKAFKKAEQINREISEAESENLKSVNRVLVPGAVPPDVAGVIRGR